MREREGEGERERFPVVYTTHRSLPPPHFHPTLASETKQANSLFSGWKRRKGEGREAGGLSQGNTQ